jgi:hypothetical protein
MVPLLIPVDAHRFMLAAPAPSSCPVFSVYRRDVICYGSNIVDLFQREFAHGVKPWPAQCAHVDF